MGVMPATRDTHENPPADCETRVQRPLLGVDPGLQRTGYAVLTPVSGPVEARVLEAGVIRLDPRQPIEQRLLELEDGLAQIVAAHEPATMAVEQLYAHYKHPRTAIIMGHARGVILALAARHGLNIINIAATHVKKHLTGSGRASKVQIQRAVAATLNLPTIPEPDDVADAIAVALCGLHMQRESSVGPPRPTKCSVEAPHPTTSSVEAPRPTSIRARSASEGLAAAKTKGGTGVSPVEAPQPSNTQAGRLCHPGCEKSSRAAKKTVVSGTGFQPILSGPGFAWCGL